MADYISLQDRFNASTQKYKRAGYLLTEFLDDLLANRGSVIDASSELVLNIDRIRETSWDKLDRQD